jgi:hypothetical protein
LHSLLLLRLPLPQYHRLLAGLHTNTSVTDLRIGHLFDDNGAVWISDLLRYKKDIASFSIVDCRISFTRNLPLMCGQRNLHTLDCSHCRTGDNILLFNDEECTQLFVDNVLVSPTLKEVHILACGVSELNRPLMAGFHKNTTLVELSGGDAAFHLVIDPILRRSGYLVHVHELLGTTSTFPAGGLVGENVAAQPTIPPPCSLWATVMTKLGKGSQGSSPVFTILRDRLATWIPP